jgi:DNA-binding transcriptional ArsR family regulator
MNTARLNETFAALSDPTRRAMIARLAKGDATVMELAAPFTLSQPTISKHLKVLEHAGLISRSREAQTRPCHLEAGRLKELADWVGDYQKFWEESYDRLDSLLETMKAKGVNHGKKQGRNRRRAR